jgi:hypothetical protein
MGLMIKVGVFRMARYRLRDIGMRQSNKSTIKIGSLVTVFKSSPKDGQKQIYELIGKTFTVKSIDNETKEISVYSEEYGGLIVLNADEINPPKKYG